VRDLPEGVHTVVIRRTGTTSGGSAANIAVDAVDVVGTLE